MALEGSFSVIVKTGCETDGALHSTSVKLQENKIVRIYEATGADLAGTPSTFNTNQHPAPAQRNSFKVGEGQIK